MPSRVKTVTDAPPEGPPARATVMTAFGESSLKEKFAAVNDSSVSLSMIVTTTLLRPKTPPTGLERTTSNVSCGSAFVSSRIGTTIVLNVSPFVNRSVPNTAK